MDERSAIEHIEKYIFPGNRKKMVISVYVVTTFYIILDGGIFADLKIYETENINECLNYIRDNHYKIEWRIDESYTKKMLPVLINNVSLRDQISILLGIHDKTYDDIFEILSTLQFSDICIAGIYTGELIELLDTALKSNIYYYDQDAEDYIKYGD